jgi:PP-loop superfamily ATP-utilizing enzyme
VVEKLRRIGFDHVALDLEGYETGKMNRGLKDVFPNSEERKK